MIIKSVRGIPGDLRCLSKTMVNMAVMAMDEGDIFKALFCVSKNHGGLAPNITKEFIQEINHTCLGELNLDKPRVVALLVLALSSSFSNTKLLCDIPARIFSYAVPLLGRISHSLRDFMSQDTLLVYLCKLSGLPCSVIKSDSEEAQMKESETTYKELVVSASNQILRMAAETWSMIKAQCTREAFRTLRACKEELEMIATSVNTTCRACLVFTLQYVQVIQVIAEVWEQMQSNAPHLVKMRNLDLLLEKLEISLGTMKFCFPGLSKEEECHVLELALLGCVLRLSKVGIWADPLVRKMQLTISRLELLYCETSDLPNFVKELKELCSRVGINDPTVYSDICDLLKHFSLEQKTFSWKFRHTKAELQVLTDDAELPLPFVPGLPVGLKFHVILCNVSNDKRVWLRMAVGELIQYAFLNLSQFNSSDFERRCTVSIPFYGTPKAAFFMLKACVCLECPGEYVTQTRNGCGGPRCRIIFLCEEKDIYLADVDKIE